MELFLHLHGLEVKQIEVVVLHDMGFCASDENEQPGCVPLRAVFVPALIGSEARGDSFATRSSFFFV